MLFPVGRYQDPQNLPGLAQLMTDVWDEGTTSRSGEQIAAQLAGLGASLSLATGWDTTTAELFTLKHQLGKALEIYADVLQHPAFPAAEVERQRLAVLGNLTEIRDQPPTLAYMAANQLVFGKDSPYGQPQFGTRTALKKLSRDDLVNFYHQFIRPEDAVLIAVGDITLAELTEQLEKVLGQWRPAPPKQWHGDYKGEGAETKSKQPGLVLIDMPGRRSRWWSLPCRAPSASRPTISPSRC